MRIVQIEDFFHPDAGYQVNILSKYFSKKGNEVIIICAELEKMPDELVSFFGKEGIESLDRNYEKQFGTRIIRIPVKKYISSRVLYDKRIFSVVKSLKPDVLYVHGNDTLIGIQYILRAKKLPFPIVTDSHMLEMASNNRFAKLFRLFYKTFVTPKIKKYGIPVIRTQNDDYIQRCLGISIDNSPWISYGSDTLLFHPSTETRCKFRDEHSIPQDSFLVVFAGKLIESKGALLLADCFKKKIQCNKKVYLMVIGNTSGEYGKMVDKSLSESENTIIRFETQKYINLAPFYQASDIAVFAKQCSLSFYDVQACGLPVVSEMNNINLERCSHENGLCFEPGSVSDFRTKIEFFANLDDETMKKYRNNSISFVLNNYDYDKKADEYLSIIYNLKKES